MYIHIYIFTWLEIKPNKQVRLYAPSHEADESEGQCGLSFFLLRLFSFGFVVVCCLLVRAPVLRRGFVSDVFVWVVFRCLAWCFSLFLVVSRFLVFCLAFGLFGACSCRVLSLVRLVCLRWLCGVPLVLSAGSWFCAKSGRGRTIKL